MSKPFNLADAKAGHPVRLRCGQSATILRFDSRNPNYPIIGISGEVDMTATWTNKGGIYADPSSVDEADLVMAPLGTLDGVEVYPGDMFYNVKLGEICPVPHGVPFVPEEWEDFTKQQYPATQIGENDMFGAFNSGNFAVASMTAVANAAIKHGIDNDYLIDPAALAPLANLIEGSQDTGAEVIDLTVRRIKQLNTRIDHHISACNQAVQHLSDIANQVVGKSFLWKDVAPAVAAVIKERDELLKMNAAQGQTITTMDSAIGKMVKERDENAKLLSASQAEGASLLQRNGVQGQSIADYRNDVGSLRSQITELQAKLNVQKEEIGHHNGYLAEILNAIGCTSHPFNHQVAQHVKAKVTQMGATIAVQLRYRIEYEKLLQEIATACNVHAGYAYADVPRIVRKREIKVAEHFYHLGFSRCQQINAIPCSAPDTPVGVDYIINNLTKVK